MSRTPRVGALTFGWCLLAICARGLIMPPRPLISISGCVATPRRRVQLRGTSTKDKAKTTEDDDKVVSVEPGFINVFSVAPADSSKSSRFLPDWPAATAEECAVVDVEEERASVSSSAALVGGTTVGAGILALPAATSKAGLVAGSVALVASWLFMCVAALLVAETTTVAICELRRPGLGLLKVSSASLGNTVGYIAGAAYAFIHYCLLVAYESQGGAALSQLLGSAATFLRSFINGQNNLEPSFPLSSLFSNGAFGPALFVIIFGGAVALAPAAFVEALNSALVLVVFASFASVVALAWPQVSLSRVLALPTDWGAAFACLPICVLALVFHNVVPLLATRHRGDRKEIATSIYLGSAAPLLMFLAWNFVVLAAVDGNTGDSLLADPVAALRAGSGDAGAALSLAVQVFTLTAVATSFFGFYYGLRSFFFDLLGDLTPSEDDVVFVKVAASEDVDSASSLLAPLPDDDVSSDDEIVATVVSDDSQTRSVRRRPVDLAVSAAILLPPLGFAVAFGEDIFLSALDAAGTFGITTLFGIVPAATAWRQRARDPAPVDVAAFVPGGFPVLFLMIALSSTVLLEGAIDLLFKQGL